MGDQSRIKSESGFGSWRLDQFTSVGLLAPPAGQPGPQRNEAATDQENRPEEEPCCRFSLLDFEQLRTEAQAGEDTTETEHHHAHSRFRRGRREAANREDGNS